MNKFIKRIVLIFRRLKQSKISFSNPYNHSSKKFWYITIIPTIDIVFDKQMEEIYTTDEGKIFGGEIEYSIGFQWLVFSFYITLEYNIK